ncbi:MAG: glycosyltransferase [Acidimicrobiia bacterium]|nr:glycosyltransferase [Acidimicrobiia bacterium]
MRVAYTLEQCWHRVPGGTATAALEVARRLSGWPGVELVGVAARHRRPPDPSWAPPVPVRVLPLPRRALYEAWHGLRRPSVERATGPVDVVHATGVAVPPRRAPLVVTVHDLAFLADRRRYTRHGVRFFMRALELARRDADLVLCSSEATRRECEAAGFDPSRLRVVPLGVRGRAAPAAAVTVARHRYGLARDYVLWVGTAEPRKNLPVVVEAFRQLGRDDLDLVLVGPDGWHVDLPELVRPLGEQARLLGFLPVADLDAVTAGARAFCYPSLLEGFGLPVADALVQGTPVVTSAGTATAEIVADGAGTAVDPRDPAAVAEALGAILEDEAFAAGLVAAGRARAAELTWERTAERTLAAYAEVVA